MARTTHRGPWADWSIDAVDAALAEVNVTREEFIVCELSNGMRLEPVDPARPAIDVDVVYSEARQQYRATLRRLPALPVADEES